MQENYRIILLAISLLLLVSIPITVAIRYRKIEKFVSALVLGALIFVIATFFTRLLVDQVLLSYLSNLNELSFGEYVLYIIVYGLVYALAFVMVTNLVYNFQVKKNIVNRRWISNALGYVVFSGISTFMLLINSLIWTVVFSRGEEMYFIENGYYTLEQIQVVGESIRQLTPLTIVGFPLIKIGELVFFIAVFYLFNRYKKREGSHYAAIVFVAVFVFIAVSAYLNEMASMPVNLIIRSIIVGIIAFIGYTFSKKGVSVHEES